MRTDLEIVQPPTTPNFGGLVGRNITQTDPDFGTQIVRVTDGTDAGGRSMQTADSGAAVIWNKNDTLLLCRSTGGVSFLFQFDPKRMQAKNLGIKYKDDVCFSRTKPGVVYQLLNKHILQKQTFALISGVWTLQTTIDLCDFATVLPPGFKIKWAGSFITCSDDSTFMVGYSEGVQNSAFYCCVWRVGLGFRVLNTQTGIITGWGAVGTAVVKSSTTKLPFTLHECSMTPNRNVGSLGPAFTGGHLFWTISTLNLVDLESPGHSAQGMLHSYPGSPGGGQIREVAYADPAQRRLIVPAANLPANQVPPQKYDGDQHFSMGKLSSTDNSVFWVTGRSTYPNTSAWMNEVRGYEITTGKVFRACHTFNSGQSAEFIPAYAIAVASQTGKFVAFCSDMMGTLGSTSGAETATLGKDARGDVFVVRVG